MASAAKKARSDPSMRCLNFINGEFEEPSTGSFMPVTSPVDDEVLGEVALSAAEDVDRAVAAGRAAWESWKGLTVKARAAIMFRFHALVVAHADELADIVVRENGKNRAEALASVAKGNETVEWACSLPQLAAGRLLQVSRGVTCSEFRDPLGVVASIVPFNFPFMVPCWTVPIALTMGNCVILKPSEKVPMTMTRTAELLHEAGVPPGVFQIVQGTADTVSALCDHPDVSALSFVGSSRVAEIVAQRCRALNKRVLALGGAKNHLVALPDCDAEMAAQDIVSSFAGCCGQRCMAASALVLVGDCEAVINRVAERAAALQPGTEGGCVGPVIDKTSSDRIMRYINEAEQGGAEILVDGRSWNDRSPGNWVGPTVIVHTNKDDPALRDEIFGPVLSVIRVETWDEALEIENGNNYGNAACIYTSVGAHAEYFSARFRAAMIGVNIGIPVPREPFSFGGLYGTTSKFGDCDITGDGCMEFFSNRRKVTTKWSTGGAAPASAAAPSAASSAATAAAAATGNGAATMVEDRANFDGRM